MKGDDYSEQYYISFLKSFLPINLFIGSIIIIFEHAHSILSISGVYIVFTFITVIYCVIMIYSKS